MSGRHNGYQSFVESFRLQASLPAHGSFFKFNFDLPIGDGTALELETLALYSTLYSLLSAVSFFIDNI